MDFDLPIVNYMLCDGVLMFMCKTMLVKECMGLNVSTKTRHKNIEEG